MLWQGYAFRIIVPLLWWGYPTLHAEIWSYWCSKQTVKKHFRVTGPLCEEFTNHRWIPPQRPMTRSCDDFYDLRLNKRLSKQSWGSWFETSSCSLWRHCNEIGAFNTTRHWLNQWWTINAYIRHPVSDNVRQCGSSNTKPYQWWGQTIVNICRLFNARRPYDVLKWVTPGLFNDWPTFIEY